MSKAGQTGKKAQCIANYSSCIKKEQTYSTCNTTIIKYTDT